ncbi:MAG: 30S ribosomal protein S16 [Candidatus Kerfeldbacteria bacterium CG_4_10_14_0_8_um_filter_42_10]|uniref:Small ribosomal subunit protein bS16 n=1 Tax=Candidatus Kerfeldbacteria bacterium CG_4_10_14_0_8_um_filter_42_10 TaxID=2014248 RepID=A0A2M7RIS7_9BACT|nr:MAG: 30S ribosomal protein S16 [Candidatus Kerfeldbacteria bacterium CG_4_10_14_0_8_um_filter_42_10]
MLIIRLKRIGKKNKPQYRIILQEKSKATTSSFLEEVGFYNPHSNPGTVNLKEDRIKYWLSQGAQVSPTIHNILIKNKVIEGKSIPLGRPKKKVQPAEEEKPATAEPAVNKETKEDKPTVSAEPQKTNKPEEPKPKEEVKEDQIKEKEIVAPEESNKKPDNPESK